MDRIIQKRLLAQAERVGVAASLALNVVNAGDQISRVLGIGYRPKLFQDIRDQWKETATLASTLHDAADYIDALEAKLQELKTEGSL